MSVQLTFIPKTQNEVLFDLVEKLQKQADKVRKSQYAHLSALERKTKDLEEDVKFIKHRICHPELKYNLVS